MHDDDDQYYSIMIVVAAAAEHEKKSDFWLCRRLLSAERPTIISPHRKL